MMPAQLLAGTPRRPVRRRLAARGPPWQVPRLGRGLAAGDLDNDGRVDLVVLSQNEPLAYFHNRTEGGHCLTLRLEGTASNRDAVGARVVGHGGRAAADGLAVRRRELPVGLRPPAPLRPGRGRARRARSRSPGRRGGSSGSATWPPTPAIGCAEGGGRQGRWPGSDTECEGRATGRPVGAEPGRTRFIRATGTPATLRIGPRPRRVGPPGRARGPTAQERHRGDRDGQPADQSGGPGAASGSVVRPSGNARAARIS